MMVFGVALDEIERRGLLDCVQMLSDDCGYSRAECAGASEPLAVQLGHIQDMEKETASRNFGDLVRIHLTDCL